MEPESERTSSSVDLDASDLSEENLLGEDTLISVCGGLVTIDETSKIIRFVHFTVADFFERTRAKHLSHAESAMTQTCLEYLLIDPILHGPCNNDEELKDRLTKYPFVDYAARFWGKHAFSAPDATTPDISLRLLTNQEKLLTAVQMMHLSWHTATAGYSQKFPKKTTALQISASFGLGQISRKLIALGIPIDAADDHGWTASHRAAENGYQAIVELLLDNGQNIDASAEDGSTVLHRAAKSGHESLVRCLLTRGADLDVQDQYGGTALHRACEHGHNMIVKLLLEQGADVDEIFNPKVLSRLLDRGVDPHLEWVTPSYNTAWGILSSATTALEEEKFHGGTALHGAAENGHTDVVALLLDRGARVTFVDHYGDVPLHRSARKGHHAVAEMLLQAGANPNAERDHDPVVSIIHQAGLARNTIVDHRTGGTPVHEAASQGSDVLILLLLQTGGDVDKANEDHKTALHFAAEVGHSDAVNLLIRKGAKIDGLGSTEQRPSGRRRRYGVETSETPLHLAIRRGHT